MLAGNHRIFFLEPRTVTSAAGSTSTEYTERMEAWANRDDTGGTLDFTSEKERVEWSTRFTIRTPVGTIQPEPNWQVRDVAGNLHTVEDIRDADRRGIHIHIYCERTE